MLQMSITPFVVSFIVNKHTNEIQSIDVLYAVNAKKRTSWELIPGGFNTSYWFYN